MDLLIDKDYLIRLERFTKFGYGGVGATLYDPFAVRYVFALPQNAGLPDGYTVSINAFRIVWERDKNGNIPNDAKPLGTQELENGTTYRLKRPDDAVYVATMTENREEGKKYKRYKFTAEELYALYQNVDLKTAQLAVAQIDFFDKKEFLRTEFHVGKVQGAWFYCPELNTKRLISSKGVKILAKIKAENEPTARQLIRKCQLDLSECDKEHSSLNDAYSSLETIISLCKLFFRVSPPKSEIVNSAFSDILNSAQQAQLASLNELEKGNNIKNKIIVSFGKKIKKLNIKED